MPGESLLKKLLLPATAGLLLPLLIWTVRLPRAVSGAVVPSALSGGMSSATGAPGRGEVFVRSGWKMEATRVSEAQLAMLDPALLLGHERELRIRIASTQPRPGSAARLMRIAAEAHEPETRVDAVEALGRLGVEAQPALLALLDKLPADDEARAQVVPLIRPRTLDDAETPKVVALLDSPSLSRAEKHQLAFTLALIGLRDKKTLPPSLELSQESLKLLDSMTALAQRTTVAQGGNP